jgi:hypothetical protein
MDVEQFKEDVRGGRIDADRLVELVVTLSRKLERAEQRIEELERKLGDPPREKIGEPFSMKAEEKRQEARGKKRRQRNRPRRCGRIRSADKIAQAQRTEQVFPAEVPKQACCLSHTRVVWRLENGQAVLVAYEVYRGPKNQYGQIPAVLGRSEFGIEIVLAIAYQVFVVGLSFDKVCLLMNFFQNLCLRKSQVDALLNQLSRHWEREFDLLCTLLANSLVVHADETSWSIRSVWAFLSEKVRLLFFGVPKDALTLEEILDPAAFEGIVISDDASVYANFSTAQKCWAHLLRKAIKLTLVDPANEEFRHFTDRLLEIYRTACRVQRDQRFSPAGREQKVADLDDEILELCGSVWAAELPPGEGPEDDYRLLVNELMKLMLSRQLFTFVTAMAVKTPSETEMPVAGTNNEAERTLRPAAEARKTGRASKTLRGARRRTVLVSVLESLRVHLATFTLSSVIEEVRRWRDAGLSCFDKLLKKLNLPLPAKSVLDILLPTPSG